MFTYTPYDGSATPFSIGLSSLDPEDWIEPDGDFAGQMAEKHRLLTEYGTQVFQARDGTREAQKELLGILLDYLPRRYPQFYSLDGSAGRIELLASGAFYDVAEWAELPLELAARLLQDDLCLMKK